MKTLGLILVLFLSVPILEAQEEPLRDLDKIETALKASPDDPVLHYRKCQALFRNGKEQEAVDHANVALAKFIASKKDLSWMLPGYIKT